jgi:hypothetical protein
MSIALEANHGLSDGKAVFLDHGRPSRQQWLHVETIGRHLGRPPIESTSFVQASDLDDVAAAGFTVLYWSPALEEGFQVGDAVCARWPNARVYALWDTARTSMALAAVVGGSDWTPALPQPRRLERSCGRREKSDKSDKSGSSDLSDSSDSG